MKEASGNSFLPRGDQCGEPNKASSRNGTDVLRVLRVTCAALRRGSSSSVLLFEAFKRNNKLNLIN